MPTRTRAVLTVSLAALTLAACEPASITEARDQLRRGPERRVELTIPVARDTFIVADVLSDFLGVTTVTLPSGVLGIQVDRDSIQLSTSGLIGGSITAVLDPVLLTFSVEADREIFLGALNLQGFEDVIAAATLQSAPIDVEVLNTADAPLTLTDFAVGLVPIDPATGSPLRDPGTNQLVFEVDGAGAPILIPITDPGVTTYALGRSTTRSFSVDAAALIDRMADSLVAGVRMALVGAGTVSIGDNTVGTITGGDRLALRLDPTVALDLTLSAAGVSVDSSLVESGLDLDVDTADEVAMLLDTAGFTLQVTNATPFGVEATMAIVAGQYVGDVFTAPGRVDVVPLTVNAATVAPDFTVQTPAVDSLTALMSGDDARVFLGTEFTAGIRLRLLPPAGGRGALRGTDWLSIRAGVQIVYRMGGAQ